MRHLALHFIVGFAIVDIAYRLFARDRVRHTYGIG